MSSNQTMTNNKPVRSEPLPLEFPCIHHMNEEEIEAAVRVLRSKSPFRYYGVDLQNEVDAFEAEFARFIGTKYALAVGSGTGALGVALAALGGTTVRPWTFSPVGEQIVRREDSPTKRGRI